MYARDNRALPRRVLPLLALAVLASGCTNNAVAIKHVDPRDLPLLVRMDWVDGSPGHWCATEVLQVIESCVIDPDDPHGKDPGKPQKKDACRGQDKTIDWVAVTGNGFPYSFDPGPHPEFPPFTIVFTDSELEKAGPSPMQGKCDSSRDGLLSCRIDKRAPKGPYPYGIKTGDCGVDPRIYVD